MIDLLSASKASFARRPFHRIRLNKPDFRFDLAWWRIFIRDWNEVGYMVGPDSLVHSCDICNRCLWLVRLRCSLVPRWFQLPWDSKLSPLSIAVKELVPIIVAAAVWGPEWRREAGLAESTHRTYSSGMRRFHDFCARLNRVFDEKLSFPTIKTYLVAVRDAHISLGFPDPRSSGSMPRLEPCLAYLTLRGTTDAGAFFQKSDRRPLPKPVFVSELRNALGTLGLHQAAYAGHTLSHRCIYSHYLASADYLEYRSPDNGPCFSKQDKVYVKHYGDEKDSGNGNQGK
eukprot:Em0001g451a